MNAHSRSSACVFFVGLELRDNKSFELCQVAKPVSLRCGMLAVSILRPPDPTMFQEVALSECAWRSFFAYVPLCSAFSKTTSCSSC